MIDLIHVSDIHFGSGESHGRINPETGMNIRFEDFVSSLAKTVDYTLENNTSGLIYLIYELTYAVLNRNGFLHSYLI